MTSVHVITDWLDMTDPLREHMCAWCTHVNGDNWQLTTTLSRLAIAYHVWSFSSPEAATQFQLTWSDQVRMYGVRSDI